MIPIIVIRVFFAGVTVNAVHPGMIKSNLFFDVCRPIACYFRLMIFLFGKVSDMNSPQFNFKI